MRGGHVERRGLEPLERGLEPDECYVVGGHRAEVPDLAIEVIWTPGGIDKLEVYHGLGVREVWLWRKRKIEVLGLKSKAYERMPGSVLFPDLDVQRLARLATAADQTAAIRQFRASLRRRRRRPD